MATRRHSQKSVDRDSGDYDYSDDFVSDAESDHRNRRAPPRKSHRSPRSVMHNRKMPMKRRGQVPVTQSQSDNITQRMLSAGRMKMNELKNHLEEANLKIRDLMEENKIMKKMQFRHEKALRHFQDKEGNLPQLLTKHANEVRALREQLKISKEKYEKTERYLRDAEDDLDRAQNKLKKYKHLVEEKGLLERDELNRKLSKAEIDLEEKDARIKELERHKEHLTKNHRHELGIEMASHRETKKQLQEYKEENENLKNKIKEKEKELEIKNIYSNRVMRPPHKLPASYSGTPLDTPPHHGGVLNRPPSLNDLSSREKAKLYEKKRREERQINREVSEAWEQQQRRQRSQKQTDITPSKSAADADYFQKRQDFLDLDSVDKKQIDKEKREKEEWEHREFQQQQQDEDGDDDDAMKLQREIMKHESEEFKQRQIEERERREFEEKKMRERENRIREREKIEREQERMNKENRERMERDRNEREEREREERDRRANEERDRREREEQKTREANLRKEQEERMKNDIAYQEERRKKDLLLARMKAIDEGIASSGSEKSSPTPSRKQYHHTQPIKNLHVGKPAYDDIGVYDRSKKKSPDHMPQEGYQPSYSSPTRKTDVDKKEQLMHSLFGSPSKPNSTTKENSASDLFSTLNSAPKKSTSKKQILPWDHEDQGDRSDKHESRRENSSTMLFAGGAAFLEDDKSDFNSSKLLPRRPRGPVSTLQSRPSVTAVDSIDDDIEEVII